jgi:hypothetical protein
VCVDWTGRPERKAVVVLGGQDDSREACCLEGARPLSCVKGRWVEQRRILTAVAPLFTRERVRSEVDERVHLHALPLTLRMSRQRNWGSDDNCRDGSRRRRV